MGETCHQKSCQENVFVALKLELHVVLSLCWQTFSNNFRKADKYHSVELWAEAGFEFVGQLEQHIPKNPKNFQSTPVAYNWSVEVEITVILDNVETGVRHVTVTCLIQSGNTSGFVNPLSYWKKCIREHPCTSLVCNIIWSLSRKYPAIVNILRTIHVALM